MWGVEGQQLGPGRALCGVCYRTFTGIEYSLKTYYVSGTVRGLRPEAWVMTSERLWLAEGSRGQQISVRWALTGGRNRALKGLEGNGNNSLFIWHLLCAGRSSKHFHEIVASSTPPPHPTQ